MAEDQRILDPNQVGSGRSTSPASIRVLLTSGEGVRIDWEDSHHSEYTFDYLREKCPCASCRERKAQGMGETLLPIYKERVRAVRAQPVGNYAVQFAFSDGHATGIYSFEYFREICPCTDCRSARKGEEE